MLRDTTQIFTFLGIMTACFQDIFVTVIERAESRCGLSTNQHRLFKLCLYNLMIEWSGISHHLWPKISPAARTPRLHNASYPQEHPHAM